jgi:GNAT superfamily N-acetyltransferase
MPSLQVRRFGADDTEDVLTSHRIENQSSTLDTPWLHPQLLSRYTTWLRRGGDGTPPTAYLGLADGRPVAVAFLQLPERDNRHLAALSMVVHPDARRRGLGRELFERLSATARDAGRTTLSAFAWESAAAAGFAHRVGLERRAQDVMRRQHLPDLDRADVDRLYGEAAAAADDYELVRIVGRTPPDLVEDMVALVAAINDAPIDDLDVEDEVFTADRLAAFEDIATAGGDRLYRLVARRRDTGALAGHTVVTVERERPGIGEQEDTAVARAHRGHRLGLLLKAGMVRWLAEAEPQLATIDTWNAESNRHMIAVNELLGYQVLGRHLHYQMAL